MSTDVTQAERDFLLQRLIASSRPGAYHSIGASSNAMLIEAFTGIGPDCWPADDADLVRCERTFEAAPEHLQLLMRARLEQFRAHVARRKRRDVSRATGRRGTLWLR